MDINFASIGVTFYSHTTPATVNHKHSISMEFCGVSFDNVTCSRFSCRIVRLGGDTFLAYSKHMYAKQILCSCRKIESGGFWQLADYPTLVFKITTLVNVYWNKVLR